jgi:hypothetical protein
VTRVVWNGIPAEYSDDEIRWMQHLDRRMVDLIHDAKAHLEAELLEPERPDYPLEWYWRAKLPERKGQRCRIVTEGGALNTVLVEFEEDGYRVTTSRYAVRPYSRADRGGAGPYSRADRSAGVSPAPAKPARRPRRGQVPEGQLELGA